MLLMEKLAILVSVLTMSCVAGTDALNCTTDLECGSGSLCVQGDCLPPSGPMDAGPRADAGRVDLGPPGGPDAGLDAGPDTFPDAGPGTPPWPPPQPTDCMGTGSQACTCPDGASGMQWCRSDSTFGACVCGGGEEERLGRIRAGMIGLWQGTRTTIWDGTLPVLLQFNLDETYGSQCMGTCSTFYWGIDGPAVPARRYYIFDVTADGTGRGDLDILFSGNDTGQRYAMERIWLSEDEEQLRFEFRRPDNNNPVFFELQRVSEP